jgi:hypothetical protein
MAEIKKYGLVKMRRWGSMQLTISSRSYSITLPSQRKGDTYSFIRDVGCPKSAAMVERMWQKDGKKSKNNGKRWWAIKVTYLSMSSMPVPAIDEWHDRLAAKELSPGNPIQPTVAGNAFVQVIMMFGKTLYKTWCSWWNSTSAIPFGKIQSSPIQSIYHSKGKSTS